MKLSPQPLPPGITAADVHLLPPFTLAQMGAFRKRSMSLAWSGRRGDWQMSVFSPALSAGTLVWVAAESFGEVRYGDPVAGVPGPLLEGAKSMHALASGSAVFVQYIDGGVHRAFLQRAAENDHRTVAQEFDSLGQPERVLKDVVIKKFKEASQDWFLTGPRTAKPDGACHNLLWRLWVARVTIKDSAPSARLRRRLGVSRNTISNSV